MWRQWSPALAGLTAFLFAGFGHADTVILGGVDKSAARVVRFEVPVDGPPVSYGALSIRARACAKKPPEDPPEVTAFLEIDDMQTKPPQRLFTGWMFASSPAISALEHPVYDVWVIDCKTAATAAPPASTGKP